MFKRLLALLPRVSLCKNGLAVALLASIFVPVLAQAEDYLAPEVAFRFAAKMIDAKTIDIHYTIADGYYMYRDRFHFSADGAMLGQPDFPHGEVKYDENFQKEVETYRHRVSIRVPVEAANRFTLKSTAQGCADQGLCYSPMESVAILRPGVATASGKAASANEEKSEEKSEIGETGETEKIDALPEVVPSASSAGDIEKMVGTTLSGGKFWAIISFLFVAGLGLAFTPCMWPMYPILLTIIVGDGAQKSRSRSGMFAMIYTLGMAIAYSAFGVAAALAGESLSAVLQNPWIVGAFGLLIIVLALSMFGLYPLQIPSALQSRLSAIAGRQRGGKLSGVLIMGVLAALIVGPCVTPPLAGVLLHISQTRDVVLGGSALFSMAIGMSVPLLLLSISAGALLPRVGAWMDTVKRFFGVAMLATALWMVSPVIPAWTYVAGWAVLGMAYGAYLLWSKPAHWLTRAFGLLFSTLGLLQLVNVSTGGRDAWAPLSHLRGSNSPVHTDFVRVRSLAELEAALAQARGKPALLDFYADWCVSCKEMENFTFTDPRVREKFSHMALLQIDVTANNADDKAMLKRFQLFGPPGIIFFDRQGQELFGKRVIGYQNANQFLQKLQAVMSSS